MLPADVTAAFISTKASLGSAFQAPEQQNYPVVISFLVILCLSPLYFRHVTKIANRWHRYFLVGTSAVFAISLANAQLASVLIDAIGALHIPTENVNPIVSAMSAVLPILWTLIISQIALSALSDKAVDPGASA
ncbi:hypothetical protein XH83_07685 [Bradyrhizobium sp. CCBAU 53351]|nr:hypothetical protein XH83_07685 [Bradyrhizobium sp. CCBAU 53351]